ncbi:hypothetical protein [Sulfurimonas sp.]|uniref:hypothetical protein n=1 Tax=Sulfurimonas sp. TaxID=2022749 RepID=UPI0035688D9F
MNTDSIDKKNIFLSPQETANLTGFSLKALSNNRSRKIGFPFYKYGKKVFYKESEVLAEIEKTKVETAPKAS